MDLKELKRTYAEEEKKYGLPSFRELNLDFEIDKIDKESDFLLRVIRKAMMEKIVNSMGFAELLLNPVNAPRIYFAYLRTMTNEDKEAIEKIYNSLSDLSLASLSLEIDSNEKTEAELIRKIFGTWNSLKPGFRKIIEHMKKPINSVRKEKSYFG